MKDDGWAYVQGQIKPESDRASHIPDHHQELCNVDKSKFTDRSAQRQQDNGDAADQTRDTPESYLRITLFGKCKPDRTMQDQIGHANHEDGGLYMQRHGANNLAYVRARFSRYCVQLQ